MKNKLEVAANLVFIAVAIVLIFVLLKSQLNTGGSSSFAKAGDTLPALPNYDWQAHDRTLLLALKKGCRYCEDSAPFYRKLRGTRKTESAQRPSDCCFARRLDRSHRDVSIKTG